MAMKEALLAEKQTLEEQKLRQEELLKQAAIVQV